jgi:hypothetical protein
VFVGVNADVGRDPVDLDDHKNRKALEGRGDSFDQRAVLGPSGRPFRWPRSPPGY